MQADDAVKYLEEKIRAYERRIGRLNAEMDALRADVNRTEALLNSAKILLKDELSRSGARITESSLHKLFPNGFRFYPCQVQLPRSSIQALRPFMRIKSLRNCARRGERLKRKIRKTQSSVCFIAA